MAVTANRAGRTSPSVNVAKWAGENLSDVAVSRDYKFMCSALGQKLIEDDIKVANAWGLLLEAEGFRVATAASAKEAAAVVQHLSSPPDLIISDFHLLDGSTGVEAVAMVREAFEQNIPAFIVTGDTSKMVQEARSTENCTIMNKPVNTDHLLKSAVAAIESGEVPED